ncbi:MAG TPA: hypothetical protein VFF16_08295 [Telluria sp.]|nr:hypothetical protein [Telluria sp.]
MTPDSATAAWRCVRPSCGKALAHRTRFCPYCGAAQAASAGAPAAPPAPPAALPSPGAPIQQAAAAPRRQAPAAAPSSKAAAPAAKPAAGRGPSLRTLSWVFVVLLAAWLWLRPSRLDKQVERAATMAAACQTSGARAELARLKELEASPRQLARIEAALAAARPACERPARAATSSAQTLIADARRAMAAGDFDKAVNRMEVCAAMTGAPECAPVLRKARRLQEASARCRASGGAWSGERCAD